MKTKIIIVLLLSFFLLAHNSGLASNIDALLKKDHIVAVNDVSAQTGKAHVEGDIAIDLNKQAVAADLTGNFFVDHWGKLALALLAFAETIVRLTPSQKDNSIVSIISTIFNSLIPNKKKGGGSF